MQFAIGRDDLLVSSDSEASSSDSDDDDEYFGSTLTSPELLNASTAVAAPSPNKLKAYRWRLRRWKVGYLS